MSVLIPDTHQDLLEQPIYVTLATVMPDGQPQLSVVWWDYDGEYVFVNTAKGRLKERNMAARPQVTFLALDPQNNFRYLEVRGTVVEMTEVGAAAHIDKMAKKYVGADKYYGGVQPADQEGKEVRVLCKIKPTKVVAFGM